MEIESILHLIQKIRPKNKKYVFLFISICWAVFSITLSLIRITTKQIILINLFGVQLTELGLFFILGLMCASWIIWWLRFLWRKANSTSSKVFIVFGWIVATISILVGTFVFLLNSSGSTYHEFSSPDDKYKLVAEESTFLLLSSISLYERNNPFFIEEIANSSILIDDGYRPISLDDYWIKWDRNVVVLAVYGNYNDWSWTTVKVTFGENEHEVEFDKIFPNGKPPHMRDEPSEEKESNQDKSDISKEDYDIKEERPQDKLDEFSIEQVIKIPNSKFGIIQVDKAMARVQWFFVNISDDKMIFISEIPDTSLNIEAKIDDKGVIIIKGEDMNGNISTYKSVDNGLSWIEN